MDDDPMNDGAIIDNRLNERSWVAELKSWLEALGIGEELRSIDYPMSRILADVSGTMVGLAGVYGLAHVFQHGCVYTPFRSSGSSCVTASENPILFLSSIGAMGIAVGALLFVFFRDEP
tara:strand:+ start:148 stop:504 length:357 start_codon:yes stop_codon:yes gene_type:complete